MILTRRLCAAFAALAVANEFVWRTMSTDAWVKIETFAFPIALMAFLMWQFMALGPYMIEDEKPDKG
jgi:intracellular septation protein